MIIAYLINNHKMSPFTTKDNTRKITVRIANVYHRKRIREPITAFGI